MSPRVGALYSIQILKTTSKVLTMQPHFTYLSILNCHHILWILFLIPRKEMQPRSQRTQRTPTNQTYKSENEKELIS